MHKYVALGAAIACVAMTTPAAQATMSGPINIRSCTVADSNGRVGSGALHIVWENTKTVPATSIRFTVSYGGETLNIREHGTFSMGSTIDKHYNAFNGLAFIGPKPKVCAVQQVSFSDGSIVAP